jgi:hypothetical protein
VRRACLHCLYSLQRKIAAARRCAASVPVLYASALRWLDQEHRTAVALDPERSSMDTLADHFETAYPASAVLPQAAAPIATLAGDGTARPALARPEPRCGRVRRRFHAAAGSRRLNIRPPYDTLRRLSGRATSTVTRKLPRRPSLSSVCNQGQCPRLGGTTYRFVIISVRNQENL